MVYLAKTSVQSSKHMPLIALCLGFFMVIIDVTIVNVALPTIAKDLQIGVFGLQWIVDGYTLTFACLLLSAGNLSDRFGAKTAYLWGLIVFVLTSLGCGIASNVELLITFRLLQGISAAFLVPTSLALINASYNDKQIRAKAIGVWAAMGGIAAASGPLLGALLTTSLGWRSVFFVNVPIGILGILLTYRFVINPPSQIRGSFDIFGQSTGIISIAALAFSLIEAGKQGWFSGPVLLGFSIFLIMIIVFCFIEYYTKAPMLPLKFFSSQSFSASILVGFILNVCFYGELFVLPLYFQQIREYSVLMTGLAILPLTGFVALASYLAGRVTSTLGPKLPIVIGLMIGAAGFLTLLITEEHLPSYLILILPLAAIGFGGAFTMPAATIAVINSVPESRAGIASGALNASRQVGSLVGVALFGTIVNISVSFVTGMHITLILGGGLFLFGVIVAILFIPHEI